MDTGVAETEIELNGGSGVPRVLVPGGFLLFLQEVAFPRAAGPEIELNGGLVFPWGPGSRGSLLVLQGGRFHC